MLVGHDLSMCILYRFHGWLIFARVIALLHKMCGRTYMYGQTNMKRAITLAKSTIREIGIICACSDHGQPRYQIWIKCDKRQRILFIFGILVGHDLSMCILYQFHGWLILARVIALFMFVWPYVHSHILCTQLKSIVVCRILFIFGILVGHDLSMPILYRFHGRLIFERVLAL
jgi:hypothetical protein